MTSTSSFFEESITCWPNRNNIFFLTAVSITSRFANNQQPRPGSFAATSGTTNPSGEHTKRINS